MDLRSQFQMRRCEIICSLILVILNLDIVDGFLGTKSNWRISSNHVSNSLTPKRTDKFQYINNVPVTKGTFTSHAASVISVNYMNQRSILGTDPVGVILTNTRPTVKLADSIAYAVETMRKFDKGAVLVVDDNDKLQGIFTERDVVFVYADQEASSKSTVKSFMTPVEKLVTGKLDNNINECRSIMLERRVRHLPILSETGDIISLLSMRDIIIALNSADMISSSSNLFGANLSEVEEQAKDLANTLAMESGEEGSKQDILRTTFVAAGGIVGAALLQGQFVHDNEWLAMASVFSLGYVGIVFENIFEFNKAAIALLMATALWVIYAGTGNASGIVIEGGLEKLGEKLGEVSEVVFFLMGAMTLVEIVDAHRGFKVVTDLISAKNKRALMWVLGCITFFLSAILDNLTTTIVMVSLIKKLLPDIDDRKLFGAMIVIAANAGGAWTPIGGVCYVSTLDKI